jgi:hypothetical protein
MRLVSALILFILDLPVVYNTFFAVEVDLVIAANDFEAVLSVTDQV